MFSYPEEATFSSPAYPILIESHETKERSTEYVDHTGPALHNQDPWGHACFSLGCHPLPLDHLRECVNPRLSSTTICHSKQNNYNRQHPSRCSTIRQGAQGKMYLSDIKIDFSGRSGYSLQSSHLTDTEVQRMQRAHNDVDKAWNGFPNTPNCSSNIVMMTMGYEIATKISTRNCQHLTFPTTSKNLGKQ